MPSFLALLIGLPLIALVNFLAPLDVAAVEPAAGGRQIVGAGGGEGSVGPLAGRRQLIILLLELQYPHTEDLALRQGLLKVVGDRAQIFPYDQRPRSEEHTSELQSRP